MNGLERYVGQVLDDKYRLERLLGQGGMGAVYLATHLGTERYVALKLIAPQFMRNPEFVERFKREARAAGRLRHPNVVDVTDFGFSEAGTDRVAYLVMEYLDGCTLSDVLAEEDRLPLYWAVDILEQVCSAVHEAHQQGIVHRDLKPDNIWLEPNGLGGYRVKVLDFGIAKLAEAGSEAPAAASEAPRINQHADDTPTIHFSESPLARTAAAGVAELEPPRAAGGPLANLESETLVQPPVETKKEVRATQEVQDGDQTRLLDAAGPHTAGARNPEHRTTDALSTAATTGLTRMGAILGTPLYMSPEQCRGESLDARSDIYSLGIIAYQMLAGSPPFKGDTNSVIRAHSESRPTALREHNRKIGKRVSRVIMSALEKDRTARPQTAVAFSNAMRANADGLGALYRRAFALYSEYFPKFFKLSLLAHIPVIIVTLMALAWRLSEARLGKVGSIVLAIPIGLLEIVGSFVTAWIVSGVTAVIVTQLAGFGPGKDFRAPAPGALAAISQYRNPDRAANHAGLYIVRDTGNCDDSPLFTLGARRTDGGPGEESCPKAGARAGIAFVAHHHSGHAVSVFGARVSRRHLWRLDRQYRRHEGPPARRGNHPGIGPGKDFRAPVDVDRARTALFEDATVWRRDAE